jgi:hypothetical protein
MWTQRLAMVPVYYRSMAEARATELTHYSSGYPDDDGFYYPCGAKAGEGASSAEDPSTVTCQGCRDALGSSMAQALGLPLLKAYTLRGPAQFTTTTAVRIAVQCTRDNLDLITELLTWLQANKIYPLLHGGQVGGGAFTYSFEPEDAKRVLAWLLERGVIETA